jgi:L-glutamine-phosphate cytidylyltransferase
MVELHGKPLLMHQVDILRAAGLTNITAIGGYLKDQLYSVVDKVIVNEKFATTNMVESLMCASKTVQRGCVISYGDIVYSKALLEVLLAEDSDITVVVDDNWLEYWETRSDNPLLDAETLKFSVTNDLTEIGGKPVSLDEIESQYIGLIKVNARGGSKITETYKRCSKNGLMNGKSFQNAYMTDLLQQMINDGIKIKALRTTELWVEIDTTDDLMSEITSERLKKIKNGL